ncbi:glycosyltransferase [uncultured Traorella sp.]|uniref:glycosyltransferase n=1 Tax=uncultured Traorella sp. TaxID=1929048 RepID=UPI0025E027FC|nr:glycosyltransferase [uncultured Traorella sp.]
MKIMLYINTLGKGGAERVMSILANSLSQKNEIIMVNSFKLDDEEYELNSRIKRYILDINDLNNNSFIKKNYYRTKKLRKLIKKIKPDICLSFMAEANFRNIIACAFLDCKAIVSVRNDPNKEYPTKLFSLLAKTLYTFADGIVFQTKEARDYFNSKIASKSEIIYNPVNQNFYKTNESNSKKDIVMVGRLNKQKNYYVALDAMNIIKDKTEYNLHIYGEGEEKESLITKVQELGLANRVIFEGIISNVDEVLDNYCLFIMSSDYEGMPNSVMEAMAKGLPILCTDCPCGGPKELLLEDELYPVGDARTLAKKIINMIDDMALRDYFATKNKEKAEEFKEDIIVEKWKNYFMKVIGE